MYYYLKPQDAGQAESDAKADDASISTEAGLSKSARRRRRQKKKTGASSAAAVSSDSTSQDSIVTDINAASVSIEKNLSDLAAMCEKDMDELMALGPEDKQKVFYALLMKGEAVMNQGEPGCVQYFVKALTLVPNPGEILGAFEKTLPEPIFHALLQELQGEVTRKTEKYFAMLAAGAKGAVQFDLVSEVDLLGKPVKRFAPKAKAAILKGDLVFEEKADVVAWTDILTDPTMFCQNCLAKLGTDGADVVKCDKEEDGLYCSEACKQADFDVYHMYICKAREAAAASLEALHAYCREEAKNGQALLMLRYVALLLTEEIKGNGTAMNGPFVHFDHLPQMYPNPNETDKKEAALIRAIFTVSNDNLADFLTDQIYASMKATLTRAAFVFSVYNSAALNAQDNIEAFRKVIGENQDCEAMAFFPLAAHFPHSCLPNLVLELAPGNKVRATATCDIAQGEPLSIAYVPVPEEISPEMRKEKLFLHFMINCECKACNAADE